MPNEPNVALPSVTTWNRFAAPNGFDAAPLTPIVVVYERVATPPAASATVTTTV